METFPQHNQELVDENVKSLELLKEKKLAYSLKSPFKSHIILLKEDITNLAVEAIVNAAQELLTGGGGVDEAIHTKAGPGLNEEIVKSIPIKPNGARCMTGEAVLTKGHNLPAKYIIHTVAPYLNDVGKTQPELLRKCYRSVLEIIEKQGIKTVAFPPIGTGFYGYPMLEASIIAFEECLVWLEKVKVGTVIFCFLSDLQYKIAKEFYDNYIM